MIDSNGLSWMLVGDITVGTATTSVSFTGLTISKDDDYMLVSDIVSATSYGYYLFANGNVTTTNYYYQYLFTDNASVTGYRANNPNMVIGHSSSSKNLSITKIKLTNSGYFVYQSSSKTGYTTATPKLLDIYGTSTFTATSITSLTVTSDTATQIGIGSRFQLYKCVAEKVADIIVTTACTSVDITGLAIDKNSEYVLVSDVICGASASSYALFANANVTNTNYYHQELQSYATSLYAGRINSNRFCGSNSNSKNLNIANIKLTNSGYFVFQSTAVGMYGGTTPNIDNYYGTSTFTVTSITSLKITSEAANMIAAGSCFTLYKIR
jgi:hypothetical protein